jgi:hypothetical protein
MTDAYREDWDITSEEGSICFASAIYSRMVGGEQDEATLQWLAKYLRANAPPRNHTAMNDQHYALMPAMNDQLRTRVEALEARNETQRQATLAWSGDVLRRIMALEAGQKPSLSTSLHSYSVGEAKPPEDCGKVKVLPDLSQRIISSLEWTQQEGEQELDSVLFADKTDRQIVAVPAHRGGQSIRFKVFADDPELSDYGSGKLLALSKVVFKVLSNNMLESGMIEVTAISVGLVADMLDQHAEYAAQQMDQAASSPSPAPTDSLVERVARHLAYEHDISPNWEDEARIAIREVAAWILEQAPAPGPLGKWLGEVSTTFEVMADMLRSEANQ